MPSPRKASPPLPKVRRSTGERTIPSPAASEEVAALVARGLTNRQIASELHLSERTVENHVSNILRKLGFVSRAQVAAWATGQRLWLRHTPTKGSLQFSASGCTLRECGAVIEDSTAKDR